MISGLLVLVSLIAVVLGVGQVRRAVISRPAFLWFKKVLPPLNQTEREAMAAGDVGWDADLFSGKPDWLKLHAMKKPELSSEERDFIRHQVATLCAMLDDYQIVQHDHDLPPLVWDYLKQQGFFALIIPKAYGGKEFSAIANSTIVGLIASRSFSAAVTVMVPNSLGPGELLMHYGTQQQKERWLPGLASGKEIPCFALTGPEAGSDAGSIPDQGIVSYGEYEGEQILGIRLNFSKRYITLAPVATVVGLAFKLFDPEHLLGRQESMGITCALIPAHHAGMQIGQRHNPLHQAFMNGTVYGNDVFIPLDWIIGGAEFAGQGWRMLVECLSAGRGISLPAVSTSAGHVAARMTGAYASIREQFGTAIGHFEGVQQAMARIGGFTYILEATRKLTAGALDLKLSPAVITAIAKYHMTEMGRVVNSDAMDVHAGRGIQLGPKNYLGHAYMAMPISITVEGANILTRNLMIFGQGATRCHPYVLAEMAAADHPEPEQGLKDFDAVLFKHLGFAFGNLCYGLYFGLTCGYFHSSPIAGETSRYYPQLTRMSRALALCSDVAMLSLGGQLKRKEMLSARLGDVLSHLYMASAVLKHFEDDGHQQGDLPFVHYALQWHLFEMGKALIEFLHNFPNRFLALGLKWVLFPFGNHYAMPSDALCQRVARALMVPSVERNRLTHLCYLGEKAGIATGDMERAFLALYQTRAIRQKVKQAQHRKALAKTTNWLDALSVALAQGILSEEEYQQAHEAERLRAEAIGVDEFSAL